MYVVSAEVQDRMIGHIRDNTTDVGPQDLEVPIAHFTDEGHARAERALMRRLPLVAGLSSELPEPGSFITRDLLDTPLLIVRQPGGEVFAMLNMCRHRGGKVELEPSGRKPVFMCSYHGWSFQRDGALRGVAFKDWYDPMDKSCRGLVRLRCEERHGLIWVGFRDDGVERPVADFLGKEADEHLAAFGLEDATVFMEKRFTLEVNWKLVIDGALDVIHPQFLHPGGVANYIQSGTSVWMQYGRHGQVFSPRRRLAERVKNGEAIGSAHRYLASNFMLYPNCLVIAAPDHYEFWVVEPSSRSAAECHVTIRLLIDRAKLDDAMAERLNRSWEILEHAAMDEDWPMEVTIQQNATASPQGTFMYGRGEMSCQHLHRQLAADLAPPQA